MLKSSAKEEDLIQKIRQVMEMPEAQVQEISKKVMDYYDQFLTHVNVQKRFENNNEKICTVMLFPRVVLSQKEESRLMFIKEGISRHLAEAAI